MKELSEQLSERVSQAFERVTAQREEILEAFIAKYGCGPDGLIQVEQRTENGWRWWVERVPAPKPSPPTAKCPPLEPPDELVNRWYEEWVALVDSGVEPGWQRTHIANQAATWGRDQTIPEREELAELIGDLLYEVEHAEANCGLLLDDTTLTARARAAAERLRGGGSDG